jgi:deoxyxylulose-5-phosphate synthase
MLKSPIAKPIKRLAVPRSFIKHDSRDKQLMSAGIIADRIVKKVKEMLES